MFEHFYMPEPVLTTKDMAVTEVDMVATVVLVSYSLTEKTDNEKGIISDVWIKFRILTPEKLKHTNEQE